MAATIQEIGLDRLPDYAAIPIAFEVAAMLRVELVDGGLGGMRLREMRVAPAYTKNYDAYEGCGPTRWPERFDTRHWGLFLALEGDRPVGGATVAFDTPGLRMLSDRDDLAALWDLRVRPDFHRQGIGTALFDHAAAWARVRGCAQLKIETQNVNVPACRFYAKQGCTLGLIDRYGYAGHPQVGHETMLIWYLDLVEGGVHDER